MIKKIRDIIKKTQLKPIVIWLILTYHELRSPNRNHVFRQTMKKILNNPQCLYSDKILSDLSWGWGNEKYSASIEYLKDCIEYVKQSKFPILECGSGLTTIVAGLIAQKQSKTIWSLEHTNLWYKKTLKYLNKYHIDSVKLLYCPSVDYSAFSWIESVKLHRLPPLDRGILSWYDVPFSLMPDKFSLVICDGHPGGNMGGQYCIFPIMKQRFISGGVILFDFADRENEEANMSGWAKELNMSFEIRGKKNPYYVIKLK